MNKKYWAVLIVMNIIMGFCGFMLMAFGFMAQIAADADNTAKIFLVLAAIGFVLLLIFFAANRTMYRVFSERSTEEINGRVVLAGNITAWAALVSVYIIFALL